MNNGLLSGFGGGQFNSKGSSGRYLVFQRYLTSSQTVDIPHGIVELTAIGPGGRGAGLVNTASARATGGGAGGWSFKRFYLPSKSTYSIVVGIGMPLLTVANNTGTPTTATSITGPGVSMMANYGEGGNSSSVVSTLVAGGLGGTASGGDFNFTGGNGGLISSAVSDAICVATGGGSINPFGLASTSGGSVTSNGGTSSPTGGGGVGGKGNGTLAAGAGSGENSIVNNPPDATSQSEYTFTNIDLLGCTSIIDAYGFPFIGSAGGGKGGGVYSGGATTSVLYGGGSRGQSLQTPGYQEVSSGSTTYGGSGGISGYYNGFNGKGISGDVAYGSGSGAVATPVGITGIILGKSGDGIVLIRVFRDTSL